MGDPGDLRGLVDRAIELAAKHGWAGAIGGFLTAILAFFGSRRARDAHAAKIEAEAKRAQVEAEAADDRAAADVRLVEANAAKVEAEAADLQQARWVRMLAAMEDRIASLERRAREGDAEIDAIQAVNRRCEERAGRLEHALRIVLRALCELDLKIPALDAAIAGLDLDDDAPPLRVSSATGSDP